MALPNPNNNHCYSIYVLVTLILLLCILHGEGRESQMRNEKLHKPKGTVKSIKSDDGDIIDCVDIYKQPGLDLPLLKGHKIEMKPTSYPVGHKFQNHERVLLQTWQRSGSCPKGTVPIRRTHKNDENSVAPLALKRHPKHPNKRSINMAANANYQHEYATVGLDGDTFYGASAELNVWNPKVEVRDEFSLSQIWLSSGDDNNLNSIEAGWMVYPSLYKDDRTRLFIYWTRDAYEKTGCYNRDCEGFVQINQDIVLGGTIDVSLYNSTQNIIKITIFKTESGRWWLSVQDSVVGYWPANLFTTLAESADDVQWGGEIANFRPNGHHTSTQMGSGRFPNEQYGKAAFIHSLKYMTKDEIFHDPGELSLFVTNLYCYDVYLSGRTPGADDSIYFGGLGYSNVCP